MALLLFHVMASTVNRAGFSGTSRSRDCQPALLTPDRAP